MKRVTRQEKSHVSGQSRSYRAQFGIFWAYMLSEAESMHMILRNQGLSHINHAGQSTW